MPLAPDQSLDSLAAVDTLAAQAEQRLAAWFEDNPKPSITDLATATQVIWRLTSVRKTLIQLTASPSPKPSTPRPPAPNVFKTLLSEANQLQAEINKLSPGSAAPPVRSALGPRTSSSALSAPSTNPVSLTPTASVSAQSIPSTPSMPSIPPSPSSSPRSALHTPPSSVPACPTLRAPLRTAQAALHQVNQLCGIPNDPGPFPSSPASSPRSALRAPQSNIPQSLCPEPSLHGFCYKCTRPFCPVREVSPLEGLACDGVCIRCSQIAACPVSPASMRPNSPVP